MSREDLSAIESRARELLDSGLVVDCNGSGLAGQIQVGTRIPGSAKTSPLDIKKDAQACLRLIAHIRNLESTVRKLAAMGILELDLERLATDGNAQDR